MRIAASLFLVACIALIYLGSSGLASPKGRFEVVQAPVTSASRPSAHKLGDDSIALIKAILESKDLPGGLEPTIFKHAKPTWFREGALATPERFRAKLYDELDIPKSEGPTFVVENIRRMRTASDSDLVTFDIGEDYSDYRFTKKRKRTGCRIVLRKFPVDRWRVSTLDIVSAGEILVERKPGIAPALDSIDWETQQYSLVESLAYPRDFKLESDVDEIRLSSTPPEASLRIWKEETGSSSFLEGLRAAERLSSEPVQRVLSGQTAQQFELSSSDGKEGVLLVVPIGEVSTLMLQFEYPVVDSSGWRAIWNEVLVRSKLASFAPGEESGPE